MKLRDRKINSMPIHPKVIDVDYQKHKQKPQKQNINKKSKKKVETDDQDKSQSGTDQADYQIVDDDQNDQQQKMQSFLKLKIQYLVSKKSAVILEQDDQNQNQVVYLVKFKNKSYHHCEWLATQQISNYGFDINHTKLKGLNARMLHFRRLKLKGQEHFNPNYLLPDRIIYSTELFSAIHHKKANQIKGAWYESLQIVVSKLLNFEKDHYPYGTLFLEDIPSCQIEISSNQNTIYSLPVILNRVFFGFYNHSYQFWVDLSRTIKKFLDDHNNTDSEFYVVGATIRQCAIFLYIQWHILCAQRFKIYEEQLNKNKIDLVSIQNYRTMIQNKFPMEYEYCQNNVFLKQKSTQKPKNIQQLDILNPGQLNLKLFAVNTNQRRQYNYLTKEDMSKLDLNKQIDKFFLVKWKQLSYRDCTWEKQSVIKSLAKIQQFKNINKMPNKQTRQKLQFNHKLHADIYQFYLKYGKMLEKKKIKKPATIQMSEERLYMMKKKLEKPKQYKGKDVIIFKNYKLLKDFQNQSLNWFIKNWYENRNTILADEMGLGKTIQMIAFLYHLFMYEKVVGPFLILAPLTTLTQWRREIQAWTNFNCLLYYDESGERENLLKYEFNFWHTKKSGQIVKSNIPKFNIFLTNYEIFLKDFENIKTIAFQHITIDEAHKLKNNKCLLANHLKMLSCKRLTLMTGTPVQNNTKQLWSLLNIIQPDDFPNQQQFIQLYGSLNTQNEIINLKKMLKPYLLRRVKQDVEKLIPKLSEIIIDVEMTKLQKTIYKGILQKNKGQIIKGLSSANFNNIAMEFRKCCNHPFLISAQLEKQILIQCKTNQEVNEKFLSASGKMILLMKLLHKFKEEKKKTLIFSQFVMVLSLIGEYLQKNNFNCEILHGSISASNRHRAITRFCENQQVNVFLISTKAGGVGINLTAATQIIIFDSDWNPQNDIQATARAHRIGQKHQVTVYRLITSKSYQSEMFKVSSKKLGMDKAIFNGDYFKTSNPNAPQFQQALSKAEIETLLKKGVLGFLENDIDEEEYFKQGIEEILQKNARKVQYSLGESCTYSKSKFVGEEHSKGIDIHADNFWEVALKDIESPIQRLVKKIDGSRKFNNIDSQQQLMLQTLPIVSDFVRMRITGTSYNAEDQRILIQFLEKINGQRMFERKYREIAYKFLQEIQKPSRRFKVTEKQIRQVKINELSVNENSQQSKRQDEDEYDADEDIEASKADRQKKMNQEIDRMTRSKRLKKKEEVFAPVTPRQEYERICFICLKPKCTIFCKGPCKRAFHKFCWNQNKLNKRQVIPLIKLDQITLNFDIWMKSLDKEQFCQNCEDGKNIGICSICQQEGIYDQEDVSSSHIVYKCPQKQCNKFYHYQCLTKTDFTPALVDVHKKGFNQKSLLTKWTCPAHICFKCHLKIFKGPASVHSCVICSKSYHAKCIATLNPANPKARLFHLLGTSYVCDLHLTNSIRNILVLDYQLINNNKQNTKEIKRLQKEYFESKKKEQNDYEEIYPTDKPYSEKNDQNANEVQQRQYSYEDFDIVPIDQVNYEEQVGLWCRYCGSRYAESFQDSPWGNQKLCDHHYKFWKKNKLDLSKYPEEPTQPIIRKETELKYLNKLANQSSKKPPFNVFSLVLATKLKGMN